MDKEDKHPLDKFLEEPTIEELEEAQRMQDDFKKTTLYICTGKDCLASVLKVKERCPICNGLIQECSAVIDNPDYYVNKNNLDIIDIYEDVGNHDYETWDDEEWGEEEYDWDKEEK